MPLPLSQLCRRLDLHPVLIDIGASAEMPALWNDIAACSTYIGFDPDLRDVHEVADGKFHRSVIVNEAVTDQPEAEISFYLTKSPYCSSVLKPDTAALEDYVFYDLFTVEREVRVKATTLGQTLEQYGLTKIDWIKIDSQGTDLRLLHSIKDEIRAHVLAVDVEPGLIDAYKGEDTFAEVHQDMTSNGFWLSRMQVEGAARIRKSTQEFLASEGKSGLIVSDGAIRISPGWAEVRYFRTLQSMKAAGASREEYLLLWIFSLSDNQLGFALDIVQEYKKLFGPDDIAETLQEEVFSRLQTVRRQLRKRNRVASRVLRKFGRIIEGC